MNIFVTFLEALKVKHTKSFSKRYYEEHPYKQNLYGIASMLSDFRIESISLKLTDKENSLDSLVPPFITKVENDFVIVKEKTPHEVSLIKEGKHVSIPVIAFLKVWSGVVLLAEPNEASGEPDYKLHRKKELYINLEVYFLVLFSLFYMSSLYISQQLYRSWGLSSLFFINLIGVYICYLLILKQMKVAGSYADKICSFFKQRDCDSVLESDSSKLWGIVGWAEVGFGYFISNSIVLLYFPHLIPFLAIFNICSLPYTFWSILYQRKVKQWCFLCLIVQILLWIIFLINLLAGFVRVPSLFPIDILLSSSIYLIPILGINLLLPKLSVFIHVKNIKQEINSMKADKDIFHTLLKKQPYYEVTKENSSILFGNPDSKICITILTNPYCMPCARLHIEVHKLLSNIRNKICVQYIFASFDSTLDLSCQFLIYIYHKYPNRALQIFDEWFKIGKDQTEAIFEKYSFNAKMQEPEYFCHKSWREKNRLTISPVVLFNGFQLPRNYKIEDLKLLNEFNIDIK